MLGTIEEISNNIIDVKLTIDIKKTPSLINLYVLIKDNQKSFIGEVIEVNLTHCKINILGKLEGSNFLYGFDFSSLLAPIDSTSNNFSKPFKYFSGFALIFLKADPNGAITIEETINPITADDIA